MKTEKELLPWPWPFPQWDGTRFVMPAEQMPQELRNQPEPSPLDEYEEAPF